MLKHNGTQTIETERLILRKFDYREVYELWESS